MMMEMSFKEKFAVIAPFEREFFRGIKKEIVAECSKKDSLLRKKLGSKCLSKDIAELSKACMSAVIQGADEEVGSLLVSLWLNKHTAVFQYFHFVLERVSSNYEALTSLPAEVEEKLARESVEEFGAIQTYLFSVLNSVVFSKEALAALAKLAQEQMVSVSQPEKKEELFDRKKIEEKYEKRIEAMAERHRLEIEGYRKQIGQLQKKVEELRGRS